MKKIVKKNPAEEIIENEAKKTGSGYLNQKELDEMLDKAKDTHHTDMEPINKPIPPDEIESDIAPKNGKESGPCPYADNDTVIPGKAFQPPTCKCGKGHMLVNTNKYYWRFILPAKVEHRQLVGYRVWLHPETKQAFTQGTQILMVIKKSKYHEEKEKKKLRNAKSLENQTKNFEEVAKRHKVKSFGQGYEQDDI